MPLNCLDSNYYHWFELSMLSDILKDSLHRLLLIRQGYAIALLQEEGNRLHAIMLRCNNA